MTDAEPILQEKFLPLVDIWPTQTTNCAGTWRVERPTNDLLIGTEIYKSHTAMFLCEPMMHQKFPYTFGMILV